MAEITDQTFGQRQLGGDDGQWVELLFVGLGHVAGSLFVQKLLQRIAFGGSLAAGDADRAFELVTASWAHRYFVDFQGRIVLGLGINCLLEGLR